MNFEHNDKTKELIARVEAFMDAHIYPAEVCLCGTDGSIW